MTEVVVNLNHHPVKVLHLDDSFIELLMVA